MAILNKITVGNKLVLEINHDPSSVATSAPIGSEAMRDDAGTGKSYLKVGASDTAWVPFQTGVDTAGWAFADSIANLNSAIADSYFGTKNGSDFDIKFLRNGEEHFRLKQFETMFLKAISFLPTVGAISAPDNLNIASPVLRLNAEIKISSSGETYDKRYGLSSLVSLASGLNVSRPMNESLKTESLMEVVTTVVHNSDSTKNAQWVKSYRVSKADGSSGAVTFELLQDDLTKRNNVGNLRVSHSVSLAQVVTSFTNVPDGDQYKVTTFVKELLATIL